MIGRSCISCIPISKVRHALYYAICKFDQLQVIGSSSSSHSNINIVTPAGSHQPQLPRYNYLVKIINPRKKSEFEVQSLITKQKFLSLEDLKEQIILDCKEKVPDPITDIGYIEPGHGLSGKKKWLTSDHDLSEMYEASKGKHDVTIWCYGPAPYSEQVRGRKRQQTEGTEGASAHKASRYDTHVDKMAEVATIEDKLQEKHSGKYNDQQLRSWAHLIQMKKHSSYDEPPDKPFFCSSHKPASTPASAVSPGKRINMRGQCVDQLLKSHQLFEKGVISKEQYEEFQASILNDVKKF